MAKKKAKVATLPETMEFYVTGLIERSGLTFVPADSHLRDADGRPPESLPSFGYCPSRIVIQDTGSLRLEVGKQTCPVHQPTTIKIRIVPSYTGDPFEWTPREIYEAIHPGEPRTKAKGCLAPMNPYSEEFRALMFAGWKDSSRAVARVIPPVSRTGIPSKRNFVPEPAAAVPFDPAGHANAQGPADDLFDPRGMEPLPVWRPPSASEPVPPERMQGAIPVRR